MLRPVVLGLLPRRQLCRARARNAPSVPVSAWLAVSVTTGLFAAGCADLRVGDLRGGGCPSGWVFRMLLSGCR